MEFREMRRGKQALSNEECMEILERGTSGVLAVDGDGGYPYAVPLSYVYADGKVWFHCARAGHKLDAIARNAKASFCVIGSDEVVPEEYTTYFRSIIAFGNVRVLEGGEKRRAFEALAAKYTPNDAAGREAEIEKTLPRVCILQLDVEHMTGKQAKELTKY